MIVKSIIFAKIFLNIFNKRFTFKQIKTMSNVADKVKDIIIDKLGVDASEVTPEASFANDLGADSLDTVELIMEFEKAFELNIPDEAAEKIVTVGDSIEYLSANASQ